MSKCLFNKSISSETVLRDYTILHENPDHHQYLHLLVHLLPELFNQYFCEFTNFNFIKDLGFSFAKLSPRPANAGLR